MTLLGDAIREAMNRPNLDDRLIISPLLDPLKQIGPGTVDLRLGTEFVEFNRSGRRCVDVVSDDVSSMPDRVFERRAVVPLGSGMALHPGQFVLGSTLEFVSLPGDLSAQVVSRSSWGRLGLIVATAGAVQPGYKGVLTLELVNAGAVPIVLRPGMRVAQMQLWKADEPTSDSYSEVGKYRVPVGPEGSRLREERAEGLRLERIGNIIVGRLNTGVDYAGTTPTETGKTVTDGDSVD
jgi:dCTP deaminase